MQATMDNTDLEGVCLVWLDPNSNSSNGNLAMQDTFRSIIHNFKTCQDGAECERFIQAKSLFDRIFLVVSGQLGQAIVPRVHHLRQVCSIYVYCQDVKRHEGWARQHPKVRDVVSKSNSLFDRIRSDYAQYSQSKCDEPFPFAVHQPEGYERSEFFHSQLLFDYLLQMKTSAADKDALIARCLNIYADDQRETSVVQEFARTYLPEQAVRWFTRNCFLSRLLTKALVTKHLDLLFLFGFLLQDMQEIIRKNPCQSTTQVFHGQLLSNDELKLLQQRSELCFSIGNCLVTTYNRSRTVASLCELPIGGDLARVLFEIGVDPLTGKNRGFAKFAHLMNLSGEKQGLFQVGSVFQIKDIRYDKKHAFWTAKINLVDVKHEYSQASLISRGQLFRDMGRVGDAEKYLVRILCDIPDGHFDVPRCYYSLGLISFAKTDFEMSLYWLNLALELFTEDDPNFPCAYYTLGCVYQHCSDHQNAITFYEEALKGWDFVHEDHKPVEMADCLNNMGCLYEREGLFSRAIECHRRGLEIRERSGFYMGSAYNNIANIYFQLGEYNVALENYNYAFELKSQTLPQKDRSLANTMINIGLVYEEDRNFIEALNAYKQAARLLSNTCASQDARIIEIQKDIERVSALATTAKSA